MTAKFPSVAPVPAPGTQSDPPVIAARAQSDAPVTAARARHVGARPAVTATALVALAVTSGLLAWATPTSLPSAPGQVATWLAAAGPTTALVLLAATACWAVVAWLTVGILLTVTATLPGLVGDAAGALARRITPCAVRRLVELAVGLSAATSTITVASAAHATVPPTLDRPAASAPAASAPVTAAAAAAVDRASLDRPVQVTAPSVGPVPDLDRPHPRIGLVSAAPRRPTEPSTLRGHVVGSVVVRSGDSLWSITARHLGPRATDAQVAAAWPRWYAANRTVIGPDPGLIRPGQRLVPPS